jgi:uncharacterized protein YecT (DUF1311 family)
MKSLKIFLFAFSLLVLAMPTGASNQTQAEMNQDACGKYKKSDATLNETYQRILREYGKDQVFIQKIKAAQRAWLAFRDAHIAAIYPDPDPRAYGSVNPMCRCLILVQLTEERTKALQQWIDGTIEGDVCAGSVRIKR